jgi:hypothetical protein
MKQQWAENFAVSFPIISSEKDQSREISNNAIAKSEIMKPEVIKQINDLLKKALKVFLKNANFPFSKDSSRIFKSPKDI